MTNNSFYTMQALEQEVKEFFVKLEMTSAAGLYPSGTLNLTNDIVLTSATPGVTRNLDTIQTLVEDAAANPTNTVLVVVTGDIDAVVITVTPNDGTNNGSVAVGLTTAQLVEVINGKVSGVYDSINVTVTDASSLLDDLTASGGGATALAAGGEGDDVTATLTGGAAGPELVSGQLDLVSSEIISTGRYRITLADKYVSIKHFSAVFLRSTAADFTFQLRNDSLSVDKTFDFLSKVGATATSMLAGDIVMIKLELKNQAE